MAGRGTARTLGVDVYEQIRDRILLGDIPSGARLRPSSLGPEYNVSVSVVREALTRLSEQNLVEAEPNLGFAVPVLSRSNLDEIVQARAEIEGLTIRLSVEQGDLAWESAVIASHHTLAGTPPWLADRSISSAWASAHANFHAQLLAGCDNSILRGICASLFHRAELYREWAAKAVENHHRDVAAEHRALSEAAVSHQAELAEQLLRDHLEKTREVALLNIPGDRR